jgi:hypothetical protein
MTLSPELVLAAATGSTGGLGLITTVPASGVLYVRCAGAGRIDWDVACNKTSTVQLYRTRSKVESVTLDVSANTLANTETVVGNGLTFTAHTDTNVRATRQFAIDGIGTADATELAAAINYGTALTVTACDLGETLLITGEDLVVRTYTGAAAEDLSARAFTRTNAATAAASITRCVNRDTAASGITATLTDGAEVALTRTAGTAITVSNPLGHVTATNYGIPGVLAVAAAGIVTVTATTAPVLQFATGTAAGHCVVASTTLASLVRHGPPTTVAVADTTSGGVFYEQIVDNWPYAYIGITNTDGGAAATVSVKATRYAA